MYKFFKLICHLLLICLQVHVSKISAKSDMFFLQYSNLFGGPLFIWTQCTSVVSRAQAVGQLKRN